MNKEALYLNGKLIVTNENGNIVSTIKYKDNSMERLVVENRVESLKNDIDDLKEQKVKVEKELLVNKSLPPLVYSLLAPLVVGGALSLVPELSENIQLLNLNQEANNIFSLILGTYVISLPIGITISSIINLDNKKRIKLLKEIKESIERKKDLINEEQEVLEILDLDDLLTDIEFNDYDLINVEKRKVIENYKRVLKK